jgi:hypothetical protein
MLRWRAMADAREIEYRGKTQSIRAWSRELDLHEATIRSRLKRGLSIARALAQRPNYSLRRRPNSDS